MLFLSIIINFGCSYRYIKSRLGEEIHSVDLIFQGTAIDKRPSDNKIIYKFAIDKVWLGEFADTIEIKTGSSEKDSGMVFELGGKYVVYSKNGYTNNYRRNSLIDSTLDDLKLDYKFIPEYSQTSFVGKDKFLTENESNYLNQQFEYRLPLVNFDGKAIIFTERLNVISKKEWFERFWEYDDPVVFLVKLTEKEKKDTGYDAILVTFYKMWFDKERKLFVLKQVKKHP